MTNFKDAFERGLAASERADTLRVEAERTIAEFGRQVREATENKVSAYLDETWIEKSRRATRGVLAKLTGTPDTEGSKRTHGIFAIARAGKTSSSPEMLCVLTFSPGIYPIELHWETEVRVCHDKTELAYGLESLAEDPRIGKKFRQLIAYHAALVEAEAKALTDGSTKADAVAPVPSPIPSDGEDP